MSPSLVKRRKTHFHNLPCGATVVLGNNGYIWICPTEAEDKEKTGGYEQNLEVIEWELPYFFDCKTVFSFQNNPQNLDLSYKTDLDISDCKNLDLSYKTDLDIWDCVGRVKLILWIGLNL